PELRELILNRAGGNPLFVEELTHNLLENGSIQKRGHQYVLSKEASEVKVPDTIQGIIASRLDRVEESLKKIMQVASVIGREFAYRILQTIMGMREELKSSLINLQGLEFIYEKSLFPELEYIFKHALTQEVAYNSLLHKRRKEIHEKIGSAIETLYPDRLEEYLELLAYHYTRSDNKQKAVEYLEQASGKAAKLNAVKESKAYFDEAMKLLDTLPENDLNRQRRITLLLDKWTVFIMLFQLLEYYDILTRYEQTAIELGNPGLLGAFYAGKGQCEMLAANYDQSIETLTKAVELCEAAREAEYAGVAYMLLIWNHMLKGDFDQVLTFKKDVLRNAEQQLNLRSYVWALSGVSMTYAYQGRWDEAIEEGKEVLKVAEEFSNNSLISFANWTISMAFINKGDLSQAVKYGELAVEKAPTPADKIWAQCFLAWARCRAGEPHRGVEDLAIAIPIMKAGGFRIGECFTFCLGEGYWLAGEYDKATKTLQEASELYESCGMKWYLGVAQRILGQFALETNPAQVEEPLAASHFEKSIALAQEIKAENELALAYAGYGRLHRQQGDIARAREYLTKALEIFERLGTLIEPDKVRKELAELPKS
ncbi:MAG: ATP-binding protein, partial [Candidatus Thorarchaeota archaeon]